MSAAFAARMKRAFAALQRFLPDGFAVVAVDVRADGRWTPTSGLHGLTIGQAESALVALINHLEDQVRGHGGGCPDCPACRSRLARLEQARAALMAAPGFSPSSENQQESRH